MTALITVFIFGFAGSQNEKYSKIDTFSVCGGEIKKDPIYKGKKALIGDYLSSSYTNTEKVLRSLGFSSNKDSPRK